MTTATRANVWEEPFGRLRSFTVVFSRKLVRYVGLFLRRRLERDEERFEFVNSFPLDHCSAIRDVHRGRCHVVIKRR